MHYYQFNIADYRKDTIHLSMLEHGAYRQLLDWLYLDETPIPKETEVVFRRLSARTDEEKKAILNVLSEMFTLTENGYTQERCTEEISLYQLKADRARANGKLGGRPKETKVVISGIAKETQTKANHKPLTINQEPITKNQTPVDTSSQEANMSESKPAIASQLPRPESVNPQTWDDFLEIRKGLKAKNTLPAIKALITQLNKLQADGHDPNEVVMQSIRSSWKDLYAIKTARESPPQSFQQERLSKAQQQFGKANHGTDRPIIDVTPASAIETDGQSVGRIGAGIR